jgi:hypothetical protein
MVVTDAHRQTYERLTRTEFDGLLRAYVDAYGLAVQAAFSGRDNASEVLTAVEAHAALVKAVFP